MNKDIYVQPPLYLKVFERLVIEANRSCKRIPYNKHTKLIRRGEKLTSIRQIAEWVGWYERGIFKIPNPKTITNILDWLIKKEMIEIYNKGNSQETHYNIVNYCVYQAKDDSESNAQVTVNGEVSIQRADTNKNVKNVKKLKNKDIEYTPLFEIAYKNYPRPQAKSDTFRNWNSLLKQYTEEQLLQFAENYKLYLESIPEADRPFAYSSNNFYGRKAYYLDFMELKLWEGKSKTGPVKGSAKGPVNRGNFEQRKYSDEDFEKLYTV